jgi:hypothetical protein
MVAAIMREGLGGGLRQVGGGLSFFFSFFVKPRMRIPEDKALPVYGT